MPITISKQKLVDAIIDDRTIKRSPVNRMYLPFYIKSAGVASVSSGASYVDVVDADDDASYGVLVEVGWDTTVYISNKTASGFRVNFGTPAPADTSIWWVKVRIS